MTIITTVFDYNENYDYAKLHEVFFKSCKVNMPDCNFITLRLKVPQAKDNRKPGLWTNTVKLRAQVKALESIDDDVILADCDMLCMKSAESVFQRHFDIGYTVKPPEKMTGCRINGGIVFVKNTEAAKDWMRKLLETNELMYYNPEFHNKWRAKYFGMNQSAMGYMIEESNHPAITKEFRTVIWNAVDCDWKNADENTRFVHIKGKLRKCIHLHSGYPYMQKIMDAWYAYADNEQFSVVDQMPWDIVTKIERPKVDGLPKRYRQQRIHNT